MNVGSLVGVVNAESKGIHAINSNAGVGVLAESTGRSCATL